MFKMTQSGLVSGVVLSFGEERTSFNRLFLGCSFGCALLSEAAACL